MIRALVTLTLIAALPLAAAGCSKRACFAWTKDEGSCPSQEEASAFFEGPPGCPDAVTSVDSEPDYDGDYCCYDVTTSDSEGTPCYSDDAPSSSSMVSVVSVGTGTVTSPEPSCFGCADVFFNSFNPPCEVSSLLLDQLMTCMCSGACASACSMSECSVPFKGDDTCFACLNDPSAGCGNELTSCQGDFTGF